MDTQDELIKLQKPKTSDESEDSKIYLCVQEELVIGAMEAAFKEMVKMANFLVVTTI